MAALLTLALLLTLYLFPGLIAYERKHRNADAIMLTTVLLGWTVLGWTIALIWACTATTPPAPAAPTPLPAQEPAVPERPARKRSHHGLFF